MRIELSKPGPEAEGAVRVTDGARIAILKFVGLASEFKRVGPSRLGEVRIQSEVVRHILVGFISKDRARADEARSPRIADRKFRQILRSCRAWQRHAQPDGVRVGLLGKIAVRRAFKETIKRNLEVAQQARRKNVR